MTTGLDKPFKRAAVVALVASTMWFIGLLLLPISQTLFEWDEEWQDANGNEQIGRTVTRVATQCADKALGGEGRFAKDFWVLESMRNDWARFLSVDKGEFRIAPSIDYTGDEIAWVNARLKEGERHCVDKYCVESLSAVSFPLVLGSCGITIPQRLDRRARAVTIILNRYSGREPWPSIAVVVMAVCLFSSLLYDRTIGAVVSWVRFGRG